jgi:hypothetical protein
MAEEKSENAIWVFGSDATPVNFLKRESWSYRVE